MCTTAFSTVPGSAFPTMVAFPQLPGGLETPGGEADLQVPVSTELARGRAHGAVNCVIKWGRALSQLVFRSDDSELPGAATPAGKDRTRSGARLDVVRKMGADAESRAGGISVAESESKGHIRDNGDRGR